MYFKERWQNMKMFAEFCFMDYGRLFDHFWIVWGKPYTTSSLHISDDVRADSERIFSLHLLHVYSGHSAPQILIPAQACGHSCRTQARWLHVLFSHIICWVCFHPLDKLYSVSVSLSPMVLIIPEIDRHWKAMFWIWTISALHLVLWLDPFLGTW